MTEERGRRAVLMDAAIELLAAGGMRALTHRAVDAGAGLPAGTASAYYRTRKALITGLAQRLVDLDRQDLAQVALSPEGPLLAPSGPPELLGPEHLDQLADATAAFVDHMLSAGRSRTLARYLCVLETVHHPELHEILKHGEDARARMSALLAAAGVSDAEQRARHHLAAVDGLIFDRLTRVDALTAGTPESKADLRVAVRGLLHVAVGSA